MTNPVESADKPIYFDNAATTFPKPREVVDAVVDYMTRVGGNPGRSGHQLSVDAGEIVFSAREAVASLFGVTNPMRVIFCSNATDALNLAIQGMLRDGGHAVTTAMEHNSTIRPLRELERRCGIEVTVVPCPGGVADPAEFERALRPDTKLAVVNHASNAFGIMQSLRELGETCRRNKVVLLADCAQTAGVIPIDMKSDPVDILAFAGHKGLYGPTGTGGLLLSERFDHGRMKPLKYGGTGSNSDSVYQPEFLPDIYESGTLNTAGLSGLCAGTNYILSLQGGVRGIQLHEKELAAYFLARAGERVRGFNSPASAALVETGVVSFNIEGKEPSDVAYHLSDPYNIMCRAGLHCAPMAHETMGTFPGGTVRFSFGVFNTKEEIDYAVSALEEISAMKETP